MQKSRAIRQAPVLKMPVNFDNAHFVGLNRGTETALAVYRYLLAKSVIAWKRNWDGRRTLWVAEREYF